MTPSCTESSCTEALARSLAFFNRPGASTRREVSEWSLLSSVSTAAPARADDGEDSRGRKPSEVSLSTSEEVDFLEASFSSRGGARLTLNTAIATDGISAQLMKATGVERASRIWQAASDLVACSAAHDARLGARLDAIRRFKGPTGERATAREVEPEWYNLRAGSATDHSDDTPSGSTPSGYPRVASLTRRRTVVGFHPNAQPCRISSTASNRGSGPSLDRSTGSTKASRNARHLRLRHIVGILNLYARLAPRIYSTSVLRSWQRLPTVDRIRDLARVRPVLGVPGVAVEVQFLGRGGRSEVFVREDGVGPGLVARRGRRGVAAVVRQDDFGAVEPCRRIEGVRKRARRRGKGTDKARC